MKPKQNQFITLTALLTALAIVIPMIMPVKIIIPPASYTLAKPCPYLFSHVYLSFMTLVVILGSTFGFLAAGYPYCYCSSCLISSLLRIVRCSLP